VSAGPKSRGGRRAGRVRAGRSTVRDPRQQSAGLEGCLAITLNESRLNYVPVQALGPSCGGQGLVGPSCPLIGRLRGFGAWAVDSASGGRPFRRRTCSRRGSAAGPTPLPHTPIGSTALPSELRRAALSPAFTPGQVRDDPLPPLRSAAGGLLGAFSCASVLDRRDVARGRAGIAPRPRSPRHSLVSARRRSGTRGLRPSG
jgi:hypothetical protein